MIKIISQYSGESFNIELKGSEGSLKELLGTILNISPNEIKGIRDTYNNYYTLSSALKSKNINEYPNNYFSIITNNGINNNNNAFSDINAYNINKSHNYVNNNLFNNMYLKPNHYINNSDIYYNNIRINNIQNYGYRKQKIHQYGNYFKQYNKEAYYNLINYLYKYKYIKKHNYYKLRKCIEVNNADVLEILKPYIEFDNNYKKLINDLFPILNLDLSINGNLNSKYQSENILYLDLLNSLKDNFTSENMKKLNYLLLIENMSIIQLFERYDKIRNKNDLIDGLYSLIKKVSKVDLNKSNGIMGNILKERKSKSHNYKDIQKNDNTSDNNIRSIKRSNNKKKKYNIELLQKITEKIIKYGKDFSEDIYYLIKYELSNISIEDKVDLFKSKFNIDIEKQDNIKKLSESNKKKIKEYYTKYIDKNIYKFLDSEENELYLNIIQTPDSQEYDDIMKMYNDLIKDDKMKNKMELLRNKIINYLKDLKPLIEEKSKSNRNDTEETNRENFGGAKLILHEEEEEEEDDDEESKNDDKKEEMKESSYDSSYVVKEAEEESENNDNDEEESGVSIKKAAKK
jgi:hypothetical protein